jgi:K+-sensing histidine kinase KdpD
MRRVGLLMAGTVLAAALTLALRPWLDQTQFVLFFAFAMYATWVGGLRLGAAAALAGVLAFQFFLYDPVAGSAGAVAAMVRSIALGGISVGTAWIVHSLQQARSEADDARLEAERLSRRLADHAAELELQVTESEAMAAELEDVNLQLRDQTDYASRAAHRAERLHEVVSRLLQHPAGEPVLNAAVQQVRAATEACAAAVVVADGSSVPVMTACDGTPDVIVAGIRTGGADLAPAEFADRDGKPLFIESRDDLERRFPAAARRLEGEAQAWAALPLRADQRRLGVIMLAFEAPGAFTLEDRGFMLVLAQQCA